MLSQLLFNVIRICARTIDFIDSYNDRYLGSLSMVDSLDGLRHYTVICCYNQDSNVSYLSAAGTHSGEGLMARGIQEDNLLALVVYLISTDMLGNTAGLAGGNVSFTDSIQQRGFTMVNVAHNGNNRRTRNAFFRRIVNLRNLSRILLRCSLTNLYTKVVANKLCSIKIDILVDSNHYAQHKQSLDYFINLTLNELGKFLYVDRFADFYISRTNNFYRSLLLLRCRLLATAVYRHLMTGTAVRTAFAGSVAALNLRLVIILTALACIATALTVIASAFAAAAIAAFATTTANLCTAFAVYALAGLLALGAYKDTALALLAITATLTVALLAATILRTTFITATLIVTLAALTVALLTIAILRTAFVAATLTIFITPLLSVVVALILLLILLHIPLSVIPIHIVIVSFSCSLRMRRSSRFADITFFRLRRFGRFWFFIVSFTDNRHSLVISCTKISFFDIIFLQKVNDLIYWLAIILGNLVYSFITHSSTSRQNK